MKPVMQSKLHAHDGIHNGNCLAACIASIFELDLWMVPPFEDMYGRKDRSEWATRFDDWLEKFFHMERVTQPCYQEGHTPEFYIASGMSPRGVYHAVIYSKGKMVHDPHPSGLGIEKVDYIEYFVEIKNANS